MSMTYSEQQKANEEAKNAAMANYENMLENGTDESKKASADYQACLNELASAQKSLDDAAAEVENINSKNIEAAFKKREKISNERQNAQSRINSLNNLIAKDKMRLSANFPDSEPYIRAQQNISSNNGLLKEAQQNYDDIGDNWDKADAELQNCKPGYNFDSDDDKLIDKCEETNKAYDNAKSAFDSKNKECQKLKEKVNDIVPNNESFEKMKSVQYRPIPSSFVKGRKKSGLISDTKTFPDDKLIDLRNVNGTNFRGIGNEDGLHAYTLAGISMSPSRSFYMNQDYLFTDSLARLPNIHNFASAPEIQKLILTEFQPYDVLSIGDLIAGIIDNAASVGLGAAKGIGQNAVNGARNSIMNTFIDELSEHPEKLYIAGHRDRKYFTKDPVTTVRNIFNGGLWLNTYELPYYGKDYLKGNFSSKWTIGNVVDSLGNALGNVLRQEDRRNGNGLSF